MAETGSCRQSVVPDRLYGPLVPGDGVVVTRPTNIEAGQVQVGAVAVGAAGESLVQAIEGGLGTGGVIEDEIDVARQQQGVACLVAAWCRLRDGSQQRQSRRGGACSKPQLRQTIAATAGLGRGGVVGQQLVVGAHGVGQVPGAGEVGCGSQQGAGGKRTLTV